VPPQRIAIHAEYLAAVRSDRVAETSRVGRHVGHLGDRQALAARRLPLPRRLALSGRGRGRGLRGHAHPHTTRRPAVRPATAAVTSPGRVAARPRWSDADWRDSVWRARATR